jgi:hypothetical protein
MKQRFAIVVPGRGIVLKALICKELSFDEVLLVGIKSKQNCIMRCNYNKIVAKLPQSTKRGQSVFP